MNRNIFNIIFTAFFIIIGINSIEARTCNYNYDGKKITIETKVKSDISLSIEKEENYTHIYNFLDSDVITSDEQCWKNLTICKIVEKSVWVGVLDLKKYLGIFGSSLDYETIDDAYANSFNPENYGWWSTHFLGSLNVDCKVIGNTDKDVAKENYISYCDKFVQLYSDVANAYREYKSCGDVSGNNPEKASVARCKSNAITEVNKYTETLKNTCNNIIQNQSLSVEDGCVSSCLQANKAIQTLKEKYIGIENLNNDCSISERLIVWIKNILKWIKFILPVIVIVMGIIDFIKAIGADKEDEMKKAQGAFVKRLIAAALVFIIPLIIEFILDKMGFGYNDCGIFNK